MTDKLRVGDEVLWSGGHGTQPRKIAIVNNIIFKAKQYSSLSWKHVYNSEGVVLHLDNGHWCYGKAVFRKEK